MQELVTDDAPREVRPMFGSGFVSNGWNGATLEEGPGMIAMGLLMGAFCGLLLGLITLQLARFLSLATGRNFGSVSWALISMALGALTFGLISARNAD